jgi:ribonuclease D
VLGRLRALGEWRELEAQDKNIPRGRIARDETIADIANHPPKTQADLAKVRGLSAGWKDNEIGRRMMNALAAATPMTDAEMPARAPRGAPLGKEGGLVADLLKLLLKIRAREIDVASRLLARSDDLELLAAGVRQGLPLLEGWRFEQFGRDALELVEGRLAFAVENGRLKMTRVANVEVTAGAAQSALVSDDAAESEDREGVEAFPSGGDDQAADDGDIVTA